eukprot:3837210-Alexandrium_andersonii.AAC.1
MQLAKWQGATVHVDSCSRQPAPAGRTRRQGSPQPQMRRGGTDSCGRHSTEAAAHRGLKDPPAATATT